MAPLVPTAPLMPAATACRHAVSVCASVTFVDCVKTNNNHILKKISPTGKPIILVFPCQTAYSNTPTGTLPLTGESNAGVVGRNRDSEPVSGFSACC